MARGAAPYHHGDLRRALAEAGSALVDERQDWDFSMREAARRAGVSHNAPYKHYADKADLLAAVAAVGFEALRARLRDAAAGAGPSDAELAAIGAAYIRFGLENPARYRLMFGPMRDAAPSLVGAANASKSVLEEVVLRGARSGAFAVDPDDPADLGGAVLAAWSLVHGLTMLLLDGLAPEAGPLPERVARALLDGLRRR